ncbi:heparan-alpha-glucosaminide N-acetyltransferase domain-containing protein [Ornithinimicrobium sp. W1679]|uniref:heparan-alpha-glucosaminide N-acetyltransferase domain-containing protein n=1 Tax=Ornithinimicrobium sp. W1679 TaxID=3418770 RepID=UPI003CEC8304
MGLTPEHATATTARASGRVVAVDVARALALLGMFAAHLVPARDPDAARGVDPLFELVAGRSSALFAVLAGVSIALLTRDVRSGGTGHRRRLLVRALLVAALGLWLGLLGSGLAVILTFYGVLFCCALPVLGWGPGRLAALAVGWGLLSPVVSLLLRRELGPPQPVVPSLVSLAEPLELARELLLTGYYPVLTWATYLFVGMAVGRLDLHRAVWGPRLALVGAWTATLALAVSAGVTRAAGPRAELQETWWRPGTPWAELVVELRRGLYGVHPAGSPWWLGVWSPHSGSIADLAHTSGCALLVLGLLLLAVRVLPGAPWWLLAGAGSMTLTLYTTHVVVMASALGVGGHAALLAHAGAAVLVGSLFVRSGVKGPLEAGVAAVTRQVGRP